MSQFYKCHACKELFSEPGVISDGQMLEVWGAKMWKNDSFEACPECDCEDIEELAMCDTEECFYVEAEPGTDYCKTCLERIAREEDGVEVSMFLKRQADVGG